MFVFRNDFRGMYDNLIIHVDGIRYPEVEVYGTDMLDYIYIPCDLIKPDSILEVEKVTDVMRSYKLSSKRKTDIITVDIGDFAVRNKTLYNDLFILDKETREYLDPSSYQIILPIKIYVDDEESEIALDYIISESDGGYYQLSGIEEGRVELYREDEIDDNRLAFYLRAQDDENQKVYQFDVVDKTDISFDEIDDFGNVISRVKSMDKIEITYQFKVVDGVVKIEVIESETTTGINSRGIVAYGGLDLIDLGDVFLPCPRNVQIRIIDDVYLNRELELHIKKNFNVEAVDHRHIEENYQPMIFKTASKNDPRYFRVYRNGKLVPRHYALIKFPIDYNYSEIKLYPGFKRELDDVITVECMPYMMHQVCYLKEIPNDKIIDLLGMIDKPFDFKWHDIYLNGRKLTKKDVEVITANKIKILKSESLRWLEIIENSRDKEYFGYKPVYDILDYLFDVDKEFADNVNNSINPDDLQDNEVPVVEDPVNVLDYILREFYEWLIANFGLINPDWLQLSRYVITMFNEIMSEDYPFELNADAIGKIGCEIVLPINPDDEE